MKTMATLQAVALSCSLAACSSAGSDINPPLPQQTAGRPDPRTGYRLPVLDRGQVRPEAFIVLAFSGGGKRSAAFSYGALRGLADTRVVGPSISTRLLDQVSAITGVSGGSFTALYYGLHRDRI